MAPSQPTLDQGKVQEFFGKVVQDVAATLHAGLVLIGDKLGLYRAMAGAGPLTPAELAKRTGTRERYVREWLVGAGRRGLRDLRSGDGALHAASGARFLLLDADVPGAFQLGVGSVRDEPKITDGVPNRRGRRLARARRRGVTRDASASSVRATP